MEDEHFYCDDILYEEDLRGGTVPNTNTNTDHSTRGGAVLTPASSSSNSNTPDAPGTPKLHYQCQTYIPNHDLITPPPPKDEEDRTVRTIYRSPLQRPVWLLPQVRNESGVCNRRCPADK